MYINVNKKNDVAEESQSAEQPSNRREGGSVAASGPTLSPENLHWLWLGISGGISLDAAGKAGRTTYR